MYKNKMNENTEFIFHELFYLAVIAKSVSVNTLFLGFANRESDFTEIHIAGLRITIKRTIQLNFISHVNSPDCCT